MLSSRPLLYSPSQNSPDPDSGQTHLIYQRNRKKFEHPLRSSRKERKEKRLIPCKWCGICISGVPEIKIPHRPSARGDKSSILQANRGVYFGAMYPWQRNKRHIHLCELRDFCSNILDWLVFRCVCPGVVDFPRDAMTVDFKR